MWTFPTCPGWDMRELLRHLSEIHLWAAAHVAQPHHDNPWVDDLAELTVFWPDLAVFWPDDSELIDFYLKTNANLVDALESAPPNVESFTFLPAPSPLAMWARRQAHETAIHRFDAENAAGVASGFGPAFASDGIDELLAAFAPRASTFPIESTKTMVVHATDTDDRWHTTMGTRRHHHVSRRRASRCHPHRGCIRPLPGSVEPRRRLERDRHRRPRTTRNMAQQPPNPLVIGVRQANEDATHTSRASVVRAIGAVLSRVCESGTHNHPKTRGVKLPSPPS